MNILRTVAVLLCAAALAGCEKNAVQDITGPMETARIKFFNFAVGAPGVNFFAGDQKVTAISSVACTPPTDPLCKTIGIEATTGVTFGNVGSGGLYAAIAPGQHTLSGRIAATVDNGVAVSSAAANIADGKFYSYYQSGIYNTTTKSAEAFVVEDVFPAEADYSVALVRFVHAISNANPMALRLRNTQTGEEYPIGEAVAYKSASAFVAVPNGSYDLTTRYVGGTTSVMTRNTVTFGAGRVYTIAARGNITVASTQLLDNTANR